MFLIYKLLLMNLCAGVNNMLITWDRKTVPDSKNATNFATNSKSGKRMQIQPANLKFC